MKIRNGFVSNSSSSSYIIKVAKKHECPKCGINVAELILNLIEKSFSSEMFDVKDFLHDTKEEALYYIHPNNSKNEIISAYECMLSNKKIKDLIDSGEELHYFSISYTDSVIGKLFDSAIKNHIIEVIEDL